MRIYTPTKKGAHRNIGIGDYQWDSTSKVEAMMRDGLIHLPCFIDFFDEYDSIVFFEREARSFLMKKETQNSVVCHAGSSSSRTWYSYPFARIDSLGTVEIMPYCQVPALGLYDEFFPALNLVVIPDQNSFARVDLEQRTVYHIRSRYVFAEGRWWYNYDSWLNPVGIPDVFNKVEGYYIPQILQDFELKRNRV